MEVKPIKPAPPKTKAKPKGRRAKAETSTALVPAVPAKRSARKYGEEVEERILEGLRKGKSLRAICKAEGMPDESTVRAWATENTPFADRYRRAKELSYTKLFDELIELADDANIPADQKRIMVDTRKWALAKALPKIYGDRLEVESKGGLLVVHLDAEDRSLL
jgi:hypothetical protein